MEKNINIQQVLLFSFLKNLGLKNEKKIINIDRDNKNEAVNLLGL